MPNLTAKRCLAAVSCRRLRAVFVLPQLASQRTLFSVCRVGLLLLLLLVAPAGRAAVGGGSSFGAFDEVPTDFYSQVERQSFYIPMRDGVRLAVDLYLPLGLSAEQVLPTLVSQTRYWRRVRTSRLVGAEDACPLEYCFFARRGYAVLNVDVRGSGASFGSRPGPWGPKEVQDGYDLVEWIVSQSWSNGRVGAFGISYEGSAAAFLAAVGHEAVKVVIPGFNEFDVFKDIAYPGGVFNENFIRSWAGANDALDANKTPKKLFGTLGSLAVKGVAPVDGKESKKLLAQAVADHQGNVDVYQLTREAVFRDRRRAGRVAIDDFSLHTKLVELGQPDAFMDFWGSWMDAGTAQAVLAEIQSVRGPARAVIGPWNHGGSAHASPFLAPEVGTAGGGLSQFAEHLRAFDHYLKGLDNGFDKEPRIVYYTMGEERWKSTASWPPEGLSSERYYLTSDGGLAAEASMESESVHYKVDFEASSGPTNRWATQLGGSDVVYSGLQQRGAALVEFLGPVLETSLEVTGHPIVELEMTSSTETNAVHVYLEAVAPDGAVTYLTEGLLHTLHRSLQHSEPPYWSPNLASARATEGLNPTVPDASGRTPSEFSWRSFREADARPMRPGEPGRLVFDLLPTSLVVPKGYRLRMAIAGADAGTFERVPAVGESAIEVITGGASASFLDLPVRLRPELDHRPVEAALSAYEGRYFLTAGDHLDVQARDGLLFVTGGTSEAMDVVVPGSARFRGYDETAQELVDAVRLKDKRQAAALFADPGARVSLWERLEPVRKAKRVHVVGTVNLAGAPITLLCLDCDPKASTEDDVSFLLLWSDASQQLVLAAQSRGAAETRFVAVSGGRFTPFDLRSYDALEFELDEEGVARSLRVNGHTAKKR